MTASLDHKRHAPATDRNRDAILTHLRVLFRDVASVLEIASGTGQHAAYFGEALPHLRWHPSDVDPENLASIDAWAREHAVANVARAVRLDTTEPAWPVASADAIFCANMIHISPFASCLGLLDGAQRTLPHGGPLVLYGPYRIGGAHTAPSNAAFDASLKKRDARWGVRDLETVREEASTRGLTLRERFEMPANNQLVVFEKERAG